MFCSVKMKTVYRQFYYSSLLFWSTKQSSKTLSRKSKVCKAVGGYLNSLDMLLIVWKTDLLWNTSKYRYKCFFLQLLWKFAFCWLKIVHKQLNSHQFTLYTTLHTLHIVCWQVLVHIVYFIFLAIKAQLVIAKPHFVERMKAYVMYLIILVYRWLLL